MPLEIGDSMLRAEWGLDAYHAGEVKIPHVNTQSAESYFAKL
jgi:hypothetical protein